MTTNQAALSVVEEMVVDEIAVRALPREEEIRDRLTPLFLESDK